MNEKKIVDGLFSDWEPPKWYESIYYSLLRKTTDLKYFFKKIYQRIRYGFPLQESWDFISWHSRVVIPRLRHLRNRKVGHPAILSSLEEWTEILDKMIWSFENVFNRPDPVYSDNFDHRYEVEYYEDGSTTYRSMNVEGTIDWTPLKEWEAKVQEGLDLFAKYYWNLWD